MESRSTWSSVRLEPLGDNLDTRQVQVPCLGFWVTRLTKGHIDTHLLILLPQLSSILRFFIYKNLKLARSRAYALTVSSRRKPPQFWNQVNPLSPLSATLCRV